MLEEAASHDALFSFHPKCSPLKLTHLWFADDHLIFSAASVDSIKVIKGVLNVFEDIAGLRANLAKSSLFYGGMPSGIKMEILDF
jgi:hypothetical protein